MTARSHNSHIIHSYLELLRSLPLEERAFLLREFQDSQIKDETVRTQSLSASFGGFISEESGKDLAEKLIQSRHFDRNTEEF